MQPKYATSIFGRTNVVEENFFDHFTSRVTFITLTGLLGLSAILHILNSFVGYWKKNKSTQGWIIATFISYLGNQIIHHSHYMDNIYRPVAYMEPKFLYQAYIFAPMEITFFFNWPLTLGGTYCMAWLLKDNHNHANGIRIAKNCFWGLIAYILGSSLTLGHYRTAPPSAYSPIVNFTIAGEGVFAVAMLIALIKIRRNSIEDTKMTQRYSKLQQDEAENAFLTDENLHRRSPFRAK